MKVLLEDDDPHVRSALRLLLENEPGVSIVGEWAAADGLVDEGVFRGWASTAWSTDCTAPIPAADWWLSVVGRNSAT